MRNCSLVTLSTARNNKTMAVATILVGIITYVFLATKETPQLLVVSNESAVRIRPTKPPQPEQRNLPDSYTNECFHHAKLHEIVAHDQERRALHLPLLSGIVRTPKSQDLSPLTGILRSSTKRSFWTGPFHPLSHYLGKEFQRQEEAGRMGGTKCALVV